MGGLPIVLPKNTVEGIKYLTPNYVPSTTVTTDLAFVAFTDAIWMMSVLASTMHRVWAEAISGGLGSGIRYSSLITYNAFPMPAPTEQQKLDMEESARAILLGKV